MGVCILDSFIILLLWILWILRLFTTVKYSVFIHFDFVSFDLTKV